MAEFIVLERGGVRWQIRPALQDLFGPDGLRLHDWLTAGQAQVVKHGPHRTVYHVALPELEFYLKHNRLADCRARLRELLRPSKARIEYEHARAVAARQVPTFEPLALGEPCRAMGPRDSFLITRALPETRPLHSFLETTLPQWPLSRQTPLRQRLAAVLGRLLVRMHDAGIAHHDLHPGNLLLRLDAEDRPELFLIDLHAVRIGAPLSWRARRANLILLNRWFALRSHRTDRRRFWRAYSDNKARSVSERRRPTLAYASGSDKDLIADIECRTLASNLRLWLKLEGRCRGINRHFRCIVGQVSNLPKAGRLETCPTGDKVAGHAVADLAAEALAPLLNGPDAPFERPDAIVLKRSPSSAVVEFDLPGPNGPRPVIYKRFAVTRWSDPWTALFRPSPALRSYVLGHALLLRCLPTPRPLAVWHRYRHGLPHEGYLLTEKVADAWELRSFVDYLHTLPAAECRTRLGRLIDRTAHLLATLHQRRLSHRDLKASNLLVNGFFPRTGDENVSLHFIDLVGVRRLGKLRRSRLVQNLARLNASFHDHRGLTRGDRLRFLRVYLRWGPRGRSDWKHWWRQIAKATTNKVRRNLRKGRPLA